MPDLLGIPEFGNFGRLIRSRLIPLIMLVDGYKIREHRAVLTEARDHIAGVLQYDAAVFLQLQTGAFAASEDPDHDVAIFVQIVEELQRRLHMHLGPELTWHDELDDLHNVVGVTSREDAGVEDVRRRDLELDAVALHPHRFVQVGASFLAAVKILVEFFV